MLRKWIVFSLFSFLFASLGSVYAQQTIIEQVKWNSDGSRLFLAYSNENIRVIDSASRQLIFQRTLSGNYKIAEWHPTNPMQLALAENNLTTRTGTVSVMDSSTGRILNLTTVSETVTDIAWSPDGQRIAIAVGSINQGSNRQIRIWNLATNQIDVTIPYGQYEIVGLAWSPDGSRLISSGADLRIVIWDARTGQQQNAIGTPALMQNLSWSPDGSRIVASSSSNPSGIWIWDAQTRQVLTTLSNSFAADVEWNADSIRLAASNASNRINIWDSVAGRILSTIGSTSPVYDMAWNPAGTSLAIASNNDLPIIIQFPTANAGIDQSIADSNNDGRETVNLNGSASTDLDGTIVNYQWIENGLQIASGANVQVSLNVGQHRIVLMTTDSQGAVDLDEVMISVVGATANNQNRLVYSADGQLYISDPQMSSSQFLHRGTDPALSPDGTRIAFASRLEGDYEIYVMNADGSNPVLLTNNRTHDRYPSWSPDGTRIAYASAYPSSWEILTMNADGTDVRQLTNNRFDENYPAWSPDGRKIAYSHFDSNNYEIYTMNANGGGKSRVVARQGDDIYPAWSPDGQQIVFTTVRTDDTADIFIMDANGRNIRALTRDAAVEERANYSPDGSQIIYSANRNGRVDLFVMLADGSNRTALTNTRTDEISPVWGYP